MTHYKQIHLTGYGAPTSVTPEYAGQGYIDMGEHRFYMANSLSQGDFTEIAVTNTPIVSRILWEHIVVSGPVESIEIPAGVLGGYDYDLEVLLWYDGESPAYTDISIYLQDDETTSNYSNQNYYLYNGATGAAHANNTITARVPTDTAGYALCKIRLVGNNYRMLVHNSNNNNSIYADMGVNKRGIKYLVADTNPLSKITIKADTAEGLSPGTVVRLLDPIDRTPYSINVFNFTRFIPVSKGFDGGSPPAAISTLSSGNGKIQVRKFGSSSAENMIFPYVVPHGFTGDDLDISVYCFITESTGPASGEGVAFDISTSLVAMGDNLNTAHGAAETTTIADLYGSDITAQYDSFIVPAATLTQANALGGNIIFIKLERNTAHADDDYGPDIGVAGIKITHAVERSL